MPVAPFQAPDTSSFAKPWLDNFLIAYTRDVVDWHGAVRFLSLTALNDDGRDVPLERLFVEPSLAKTHLQPELMDKPQDTVRLTKALVEHPRLVLLGDPGSGKSTVVNWICTLLRQPDSVVTRALGPLVPVPLVLRELGVGRDVTWESLLRNFLERPVGKWLREERARHVKMEDSVLGRLLESGQAIVLLDGLDEIGDAETRRALRSVVHAAMSKYPRVRWVLTSRSVGYEEVQFDGEWQRVAGDGTKVSHSYGVNSDDHDWWQESAAARGLRELATVGPPRKGADGKTRTPRRKHLLHLVATRLYLAPFDDRQVEQFATHWWAQQSANPHLTRIDSKGFVARLRQNPGLAAITRNPIMLTMAAQVFRASRDLPDGRAMLYREIARAYLGTLDKQKGLEHLRPIPNSEAEMLGWLATIGWHLQRRRTATQPAKKGDALPEVLVTYQELLAMLTPVIEASNPAEKLEVARLFLAYAGQRSGLLLPRGQGKDGQDLFAFVHLSFQEYFAGEFLRQRMSNRMWGTAREPVVCRETKSCLSDVQGYLQSPLWREMFYFAFESISDNTPDNLMPILTLLLGWPSPDEPCELEQMPTVERMKALHGEKDREKSSLHAEWRGENARAITLAALLANPHIALAEPERSAIRERVIRWELARQTGNDRIQGIDLGIQAEVFPSLLSRPATFDAGIAHLCQIAQATKCQMLSLAGCTSVMDLTPLSGLLELRNLWLSGCTSVSDLRPLIGLQNLQILALNDCAKVSDLTPLSSLRKLIGLLLEGCASVSDLSPLNGLLGLGIVQLARCTSVSDLTPLSGLSLLQYLVLDGCTSVSDASVAALKAKLPNLRIIR